LEWGKAEKKEKIGKQKKENFQMFCICLHYCAPCHRYLAMGEKEERCKNSSFYGVMVISFFFLLSLFDSLNLKMHAYKSPFQVLNQ